MTCYRCCDIHTAQKEGKTNQKCTCDCHISYSSSSTLICTCGNYTTNICPVHGNSFILSNTGGDIGVSGSATINI